ncbi:hypothetical protein [Mycobacterium sp. SMC-4]|nr:hypothetical protein [Mycobacterium sp. SMC-4]
MTARSLVTELLRRDIGIPLIAGDRPAFAPRMLPVSPEHSI